MDTLIKIVITMSIIIFLSATLYASTRRDALVEQAYENCGYRVDIDGNMHVVCE